MQGTHSFSLFVCFFLSFFLSAYLISFWGAYHTWTLMTLCTKFRCGGNVIISWVFAPLKQPLGLRSNFGRLVYSIDNKWNVLRSIVLLLVRWPNLSQTWKYEKFKRHLSHLRQVQCASKSRWKLLKETGWNIISTTPKTAAGPQLKCFLSLFAGGNSVGVNSLTVWHLTPEMN